MFHLRGSQALILLVGCLVLLSSTCSAGGKTYRKYMASFTQSESIRACGHMGGRLALPRNAKENELIWRAIGVDDNDYYYWISGSDEHSEGRWVDSITGDPLRYTNFKRGEPDNSGGYEHCIQMHSGHSTWTDEYCDYEAWGYVCEFED